MKKKEIAYTIGYMDNNDIAYIGWNSEIDYYDVVFTDGLSDEEDWAFVETNPDHETVNVIVVIQKKRLKQKEVLHSRNLMKK